jgi:hypothetical protein
LTQKDGDKMANEIRMPSVLTLPELPQWGQINPDGSVTKYYATVPASRQDPQIHYSQGGAMVGKSEVRGYLVSTVFLRINHGLGDERWFETMVFHDGSMASDRYQERYTTVWEAEFGHDRVVKEILDQGRTKDGWYCDYRDGDDQAPSEDDR